MSLRNLINQSRAVAAAMALVAALGAAVLQPVQAAPATKVGPIVFGTSYRIKGPNILIINRKSQFRNGEQIAYVARIPGGPHASQMTVAFFYQSGKHLVEVSHHTRGVRNGKDQEFSGIYSWTYVRKYGLTRLGTYIMRLYRGTTLLAQGTLTRIA